MREISICTASGNDKIRFRCISNCKMIITFGNLNSTMDKKVKIYTKTGDDGTTGLIGGTRIRKSDSRLEAYGTIDELNSWIGLIRAGNQVEKIDHVLCSIQNQLFAIASYWATDTLKSDLRTQLFPEGVDAGNLESEMDEMQSVIPQISNFILPGGSVLSAQCQIARTICRRAERRIESLLELSFDTDDITLIYINRLSDYLFVLARYFNYLENRKEECWEPVLKKDS